MVHCQLCLSPNSIFTCALLCPEVIVTLISRLFKKTITKPCPISQMINFLSPIKVFHQKGLQQPSRIKELLIKLIRISLLRNDNESDYDDGEPDYYDQKYVCHQQYSMFVLYLHTKLTILCNNIHIVLIFISSKTTSLDNKRPRSQVQY